MTRQDSEARSSNLSIDIFRFVVVCFVLLSLSVCVFLLFIIFDFRVFVAVLVFRVCWWFSRGFSGVCPVVFRTKTTGENDNS